MSPEIVYDLILSIERQRIRDKKIPTAVLLARDLLPRLTEYIPAEVREALNELVKTQRLSFGRTINDVWFKIKA